jgi:hypothetical protein
MRGRGMIAALAVAALGAAASAGAALQSVREAPVRRRKREPGFASTEIDYSGGSANNKVARGAGMAAHRAAMKKRRQNKHRAASKRAGGRK